MMVLMGASVFARIVSSTLALLPTGTSTTTNPSPVSTTVVLPKPAIMKTLGQISSLWQAVMVLANTVRLSSLFIDASSVMLPL
jgi:hypothetical protein